MTEKDKDNTEIFSPQSEDLQKDGQNDNNEKRLWKIFTALSLVLSLLIGVLAGVLICQWVANKAQAPNQTPTYVIVDENGKELSGDIQLFFEVYNLIAANYAGEMSPDEAMKEAVAAYVKGLNDPYSVYMTHEEKDTFIDGDYGKKVGIGVRIYRLTDPAGMHIYQVMGNSPAEKAGVLRGDIVVAVDGAEVTNENYSAMVDNVSGEAGTVVTITVKRGEQTLDIPITRGDFIAGSVEYRLLESAPDVGYVHILSLATNTAKEFKTAIESLKAQGAKSYIFDVRNDGGGYLETIIEVLDMLLPEGPIIRYTDANGKETADNSDASVIVEAPMAVITNSGTASAAELFAAALKDYKLATLVGETTYGKGVMQTLFALSNGDTVKLTTSLYYPPFSDNYNGVGVVPDVEVKWEGDKPHYILSEEEDTQLQAAISALEEKAQQD